MNVAFNVRTVSIECSFLTFVTNISQNAQNSWVLIVNNSTSIVKFIAVGLTLTGN